MKKIWLIICIILAILPGLVSARISINITIANTEAGKNISFNYTLVSDLDQEVIYYPLITCPYLNEPIPKIIKVSLFKDAIFKTIFSDFLISPKTSLQECSAKIVIVDPVEQQKEVKFNIGTIQSEVNQTNSTEWIKETKPIMNFSLAVIIGAIIIILLLIAIIVKVVKTN